MIRLIWTEKDFHTFEARLVQLNLSDLLHSFMFAYTLLLCVTCAWALFYAIQDELDQYVKHDNPDKRFRCIMWHMTEKGRG